MRSFVAFFLFFKLSLQNLVCVFLSSRTFQFRLATFQGLKSHMWLIVTVLYNTGSKDCHILGEECLHEFKKFIKSMSSNDPP